MSSSEHSRPTVAPDDAPSSAPSQDETTQADSTHDDSTHGAAVEAVAASASASHDVPGGGAPVADRGTPARAGEGHEVTFDAQPPTNPAMPESSPAQVPTPVPSDDIPADTAPAEAAQAPAHQPIPDGETPATDESAPPERDAPTEDIPPPAAAPATTVRGGFEAYSIGDPGRAFTHAVSLTETKHRDSHDVVIDAAQIPDPDGTPRLVLRAASSRGLAHQQYGDPRQDDHCIVLTRDGEWLVVAVADGVSAGEWSHLAAKIATEEGVAQVAHLLATHTPAQVPYREVFHRLADLLADVCTTLPDSEPAVDLTPQEVSHRMATTLVIGVVATRPSDDGTHAVTVVRLGDSGAWILDVEHGFIPLGDVKNAGNVIAESATACLPLVPDADPIPVETTLGAGAALVLMTDGIGDPLGGGGGEVGQALAHLWARPPHPLEFASQVAFGRKTFDDDRGAVAVWLVVPA